MASIAEPLEGQMFNERKDAAGLLGYTSMKGSESNLESELAIEKRLYKPKQFPKNIAETAGN